ncbi:hypothetical protein H696_00910 [Fonticula alba]|uniref:Vacuolar import/degradation Vid27 C-terminal domain-containing protein n=1 Tax=Fonticula alba TaxID=691883 RepID=A0A058ZHD2_FONAL|nr:hypothetical protein H696_00910 [Fonticula alba]KCV73371.1 hypothetical protein H696_00910 [Fonticula alba]|eukprot:XP_009493072.1 hypothetical protein H696_00910 [Fonticula alba]
MSSLPALLRGERPPADRKNSKSESGTSNSTDDFTVALSRVMVSDGLGGQESTVCEDTILARKAFNGADSLMVDINATQKIIIPLSDVIEYNCIGKSLVLRTAGSTDEGASSTIIYYFIVASGAPEMALPAIDKVLLQGLWRVRQPGAAGSRPTAQQLEELRGFRSLKEACEQSDSDNDEFADAIENPQKSIQPMIALCRMPAGFVSEKVAEYAVDIALFHEQAFVPYRPDSTLTLFVDKKSKITYLSLKVNSGEEVVREPLSPELRIDFGGLEAYNMDFAFLTFPSENVMVCWGLRAGDRDQLVTLRTQISKGLQRNAMLSVDDDSAFFAPMEVDPATHGLIKAGGAGEGPLVHEQYIRDFESSEDEDSSDEDEPDVKGAVRPSRRSAAADDSDESDSDDEEEEEQVPAARLRRSERLKNQRRSEAERKFLATVLAPGTGHDLVVGYSGDAQRSYILRGSQVGIYRHLYDLSPAELADTDGVAFQGVHQLTDSKKKAITPSQMVVADNARSIALLTDGFSKMDIETGVVTEYEAPSQTIRALSGRSKFSQMSDEKTFVGISKNKLHILDSRVAKVDTGVGMEYKDSTRTNFLQVCTTNDGHILAVSQDGTLRLYDKPDIRAKNLYKPLPGRVVSCDVTADGNYILLAFTDCVLLINNSYADTKAAANGFSKVIPKDRKPVAIRLMLKPLHLKQLLRSSSAAFTNAYFSVGDKVERSIIATVGNLMIRWSMRAVLRGHLDEYTVSQQNSAILDFGSLYSFTNTSRRIAPVSLSLNHDLVSTNRFMDPTRATPPPRGANAGISEFDGPVRRK